MQGLAEGQRTGLFRFRCVRQAREHHARALHIATELGDHSRVGWAHAAMAEVCLANRELESAEAHVSSVMDAAKAAVTAAAAQGQQADNKLALEAMLLGARRRTALVRAPLSFCERRTVSVSDLLRPKLG